MINTSKKCFMFKVEVFIKKSLRNWDDNCNKSHTKWLFRLEGETKLSGFNIV